MPKQEKRVQFDWTDHKLKPRFVDRQALANWKDGPTKVDYLKQLRMNGSLVVKRAGQVYLFEPDVPGRVRGRVLVAQEHQPLPAELTVQ